MNTPDLTRKVLGYRMFTLGGGDLCSLNAGNRWMPGPNKARCDIGMRRAAGGFNRMYFSLLGQQPPTDPPPAPVDKHAAPAPSCDCGLYAYHRMPEAWTEGTLKGHVGAVVNAWGRMEVHREGFRSEYAEIALLVHDPYCGPNRLKKIRKAARTYDVGVVSVDDLDAEARSLGVSIPESLLPEKQPEPEPEPTPAESSLEVPKPGSLLAEYEAIIGKPPGLWQPPPQPTSTSKFRLRLGK